MTKLTILTAAAALTLSTGGALAQTYALPGSYPANAAVAGTPVPGLVQGALVAPRPYADAVETGSIRAVHRSAATPRAR